MPVSCGFISILVNLTEKKVIMADGKSKALNDIPVLLTEDG